MISTEIRC